MVWSRDKLIKVLGERTAERAKLEPLERAALAYARMEGLTDEVGVDRDNARRALDRALDALDAAGPDSWRDLDKLAQDLGDVTIIGLMQYSLERSVEQMRALAPVPGTEPTSEPDTESAVDGATSPVKKKRRDKDR